MRTIVIFTLLFLASAKAEILGNPGGSNLGAQPFQGKDLLNPPKPRIESFELKVRNAEGDFSWAQGGACNLILDRAIDGTVHFHLTVTQQDAIFVRVGKIPYSSLPLKMGQFVVDSDQRYERSKFEYDGSVLRRKDPPPKGPVGQVFDEFFVDSSLKNFNQIELRSFHQGPNQNKMDGHLICQPDFLS